MSQETRRQMRLLVFFDLPVTTREAKREYVKFRRFLLKDGYDMLQWSVYGRISGGADAVEKHVNRLKNNLPPAGSVRCLPVSEKQFARMLFMIGPKKKQETKVTADQMLLF